MKIRGAYKPSITGYSLRGPWLQLLPNDELREWAIRTIIAEVDRLGNEYGDTYRVAEIGNPEQEQLFAEIEESGCCGSRKFEAIGPDGNKYALGYNYGH